jgi:hypothetical protein
MASLGSRRGFAEKLSLPLMVLAFLAVGGFLYWLTVTAEPTEVVIAEPEEESGPGNAAMVDSPTFLAGPAQYLSQTVEVTGARVSSRLGAHAFWIGPDDRPFLVKMGPQVLATNPQVLVEQIVTIVGEVHMMSDSALAAWDAAGAFPNAGDKIVAEFAVGSPFLEASAILAQRTGGGEGGGSGD